MDDDRDDEHRPGPGPESGTTAFPAPSLHGPPHDGPSHDPLYDQLYDDAPPERMPHRERYTPPAVQWHVRPNDGPSRRTLIVAGAVVVAAAGGGVALGLSTRPSSGGPAQARIAAELQAAVLAEQVLVARLTKALTRARGAQRSQLRMVRDNHRAHLAALTAEIADSSYPAAVPSQSARPPQQVGDTARPALAAAEAAAAHAAADRATQLTGRAAALLASIAACEATHAELLR